VPISCPAEDRRLSWPGWLITYRYGIPADGHPSYSTGQHDCLINFVHVIMPWPLANPHRHTSITSFQPVVWVWTLCSCSQDITLLPGNTGFYATRKQSFRISILLEPWRPYERTVYTVFCLLPTSPPLAVPNRQRWWEREMDTVESEETRERYSKKYKGTFILHELR